MDPKIFFSTSFDLKKHLMVAYDDYSIGRKIEFQFIKDGLNKNELGIYLIHNENVEQIEIEMLSFGIDVSHYKSKGLLKIIHIKNPVEETLDLIEWLPAKIQEILPKSENYLRIVGRAIPDVGIEIAMAIQIKWEKIFHHNIFDKLNVSMLCTYDLCQVQSNRDWIKWLLILKENHHEYIICKDGKCDLTINY